MEDEKIDFEKEAEIDMFRVKDAMNMIAKAFKENGVDHMDGHVAMAVLLRKSGEKELFDFMAVQIESRITQRPNQQAHN